MSDEERPIESPPEGASCAEHPERDALVICPRCGSFCCIACWHGSLRRCAGCLARDPGPPVPWEDASLALPRRFAKTLTDAFRPSRSAPSFATSEWKAAFSFFLLTFLPVALLAGIIPYTHTLLFGAGVVRLLGSPSTQMIAIDVARAAGLGLLVEGTKLLCLTVPYLSLSRAYGSGRHPHAGLSVMLYRGWLVPLTKVLFGLLNWLLPVETELTVAALVLLCLACTPLVLLISSMLSGARVASGVGPIAALVVALVPFVVMILATQLGLLQVLAPWIPDPEAVRQAVGPT